MIRVLLAEFAILTQLKFFLDLLFVAGSVIGNVFTLAAFELHQVFFGLCCHTIMNDKL